MGQKFQTTKHGALPYQTIVDLISARCIIGAKEGNVKPSSLDLSLSREVYSVEGIFQPRKAETVREVLEQIRKKKHDISVPLKRGQMYMVRLNETLALPRDVYAFCNPKSTSGRMDMHVRLLADRVSRYDSVTRGFKGELWVSVVPNTFSVLLHEGLSLNQLRFFNTDTRLSDVDIERAMKQHKLLWNGQTSKAYKSSDISIRDNDGSIILTLDLESTVLGYEAMPTQETVDLSRIGAYNAKKFFKPVSCKNGFLYLKKDAFYILSTHEAVRVPPELACEMLPMDERSGDFRSHYAGFIDPGWGWGKRGEEKGRTLTLEVRPFEDLIVRQGQPIAKIRFERMAEVPTHVYDTLSSNYSVQKGPKLAKHFK